MEFFDPKFIKDDESIAHTFIYIITEENVGLRCGDKGMTLRFPAQNLTESNLIYLAYPLLEKQFAQMGLSSCHSACVCKNGEATSIIGEAGAGKTSLAVNLCQDYDFNRLRW